MEKPVEDLSQRWIKTVEAIGIADNAPAFEDVCEHHEGEDRAYHTMQHIGECLELLDRFWDIAERPWEISYAIFMHDVVHDTLAKDNEERSAEMAARSLAAPFQRYRIRGLILATRHADLLLTTDEKLIADLDLGILAAPPARFEEYSQAIRREYAWVDEAIYWKRRAEVLRSFLNRPAIYRIEAVRHALEPRARKNLKHEIERLQANRQCPTPRQR